MKQKQETTTRLVQSAKLHQVPLILAAAVDPEVDEDVATAADLEIDVGVAAAVAPEVDET